MIRPWAWQWGGAWAGDIFSSEITSYGISHLAWQVENPGLNIAGTRGLPFARHRTANLNRQPTTGWPVWSKNAQTVFHSFNLLSRTDCLVYALQKMFGKCLLKWYWHLGYKKRNKHSRVQYALSLRLAKHIGAQGPPVFPAWWIQVKGVENPWFEQTPFEDPFNWSNHMDPGIYILHTKQFLWHFVFVTVVRINKI